MTSLLLSIPTVNSGFGRNVSFPTKRVLTPQMAFFGSNDVQILNFVYLTANGTFLREIVSFDVLHRASKSMALLAT